MLQNNDLVLAYVLGFSVRIEIDLVLVCRAKITNCILCGGRHWPDFSMGIEIDLVFVWVVKNGLVLCTVCGL